MYYVSRQKTTMTAKFVGIAYSVRDGRLYRCNPPVRFGRNKTTNFIVSSASSVFGKETFLFAADKDGNILSWMELPGSFKGDLDHSQAIINAGYELI